MGAKVIRVIQCSECETEYRLDDKGRLQGDLQYGSWRLESAELAKPGSWNVPKDTARVMLHYQRDVRCGKCGYNEVATDHKTVTHDLAAPSTLPEDTVADCQTVGDARSDD